MIYLVAAVFVLTVLSIFVNQGVIKTRYLSFLDIPYFVAPLVGAVIVYTAAGMSLGHAYQGLFGVPAEAGLMGMKLP